VFCLGKWLSQNMAMYLSIVAFLFIAVLDILLIRRIRKLSKHQQKVLMLTEDASHSGVWVFICFQLITSRFIWGSHATQSDARLYALILFVVLLTVALIANYEFCQALYSKARDQYPAAFKPVEAT
jgi:hypothetical protein